VASNSPAHHRHRPWHERCTIASLLPLRPLSSPLLCLALLLCAPASGRAQTLLPASAEVEDGQHGDGSTGGWRAVSGLRLEQWIAPVDDHLRFDVRLHLPEMGLGERFSVQTFDWERLDVAEGRSDKGESGTVYHLLGARYRHETDSHGFFVGAHALTWSGHGRPLTPWLGLRIGGVDGMSVTAEANLLGLGPLGGELLSPLDDADITFAANGPRIGACRIGARGRLRDVRHPDRHQREQMISVGVEFSWARRKLFLGAGLQHEMRHPPADAAGGAAPAADRMEPAGASAEIRSTAVMFHLDAETPLPRSLVGD